MKHKSIVLAILLPLTVPVGAATSFTGLGITSPSGFANASASTPDGSAVVGWHQSGGSNHGFRWTSAGGSEDIGSYATGISSNGSVVVGQMNDNQASVWTSTTGNVGIGFNGGTTSFAWGVSSNGATVYGSSYSTVTGKSSLFSWTNAGGMENLGTVGFTPSAVSSNGAFTGYTGNYNSQAFLYTGGTTVPLGVLPGHAGSFGFGISSDGSTVVGSSFASGQTDERAFRWDAVNGMQSLNIANSRAFGASNNGAVIAGSYDGNTQAFIWDSTHGGRNFESILSAEGIDMTGWTLQVALGVSSDGKTIVGRGINSLGLAEAFVAHSDVSFDQINGGSDAPSNEETSAAPEPSRALLLIMGLAGAVLRRRRKLGHATCDEES